jgi:serine/threonine-protein kinase
MSAESISLSEREERFGEIAFAYLRAREQGQRPDPREWLARHPEFAVELAGFIADQEAVDRLGAPLREIARAAERPSTEDPDITAPENGDSSPPAAPRSFGDYEVEEELARGGMGVVYRARQRCLNRLVALKVIRAGEWASEEDVRRFRNEAETVALLDHPGVVPVHEVGEQAGHVYFSMKLIEGGSLARHLGRFRDDPRAAAGLLAAVARAVHHAHQRGVLHRDLKPSNILLDEGGRPHVSDFGLARRVEADSSLTQSGAIVGTPAYMAPEQATGRKGAMTTATDVYGLGAVLYALLAGRPPFQAENALETLVHVREREPQPPSVVNRRVPRDLETICLKCLHKEPQRRYGSALAVAADLQRFLAGQPIQARPVGVWEWGVKWARRRPLAVAAAAGLVAALVLLGAAAGWVLSDRAARQREAQAKVREAEGKVRDALEQAAPALREGNPGDRALISALARAEAQLGSGLTGEDLRQLVQQLRKDVRMLAELERVRLAMTTLRDHTYEREYANAFREYGIDLETLGLEEAAALVQVSAIRLHLAASLDVWAGERAKASNEEERQLATRLLELARRVDPDPWRNRLRDIVLSRNGGDIMQLRRDLEQLARTAPVEELPAATLGLLGTLGPARANASGPMAEALQRAQRRFPGDFWINHNLGITLAQLQPPRLEEATGFARAAVALRPESPMAHANLGITLRRKGDIDGAIAEYREAIRLKDDSSFHTILGRALDDKGQLDQAIAEHREAVRLKADSADAHEGLGLALTTKGNLDGAIAEYKEALALDPKLAQAHFNLGIALRDKGDLDGAIAEFRKAIALDPWDADAHNEVGVILSDRGQLDEAITEYREALRLEPGDARSRNNLGLALSNKGLVDEAIAEFRKVILLRKDFASAYSNLGNALSEKGELGEALAAYREAVRLAPDSPRAVNNLAWFLATCPDAQLGDPAEAVRLAEKAVSLPRAEKSGAWNTLGAARYRARDFSGSVAALGQSVRLHSGGDSFDWLYLAMAHWQLGHKGEARQWYDKAVQWMDKNKTQDQQLIGLRAEAAALLGIQVQPTPGKEKSSPKQ